MFWQTAWRVFLSMLWRNCMLVLPASIFTGLFLNRISDSLLEKDVGLFLAYIGAVALVVGTLVNVWVLGEALKGNELLPEQQKRKWQKNKKNKKSKKKPKVAEQNWSPPAQPD